MSELSGQEILDLLNKVLESNQDANKEMIKDLAFQITHPAPTEAEMQASKNLWAARAEMAKIETQAKARKRRFCIGASPNPHRRPNDPIFQGAFGGQSLVQWHLTQYSSRNSDGRLCLSEPTPVGVCQWCHTEFKPGDEDYAEALSWGVNTKVNTATMNVRTGDWAEIVEQR